VKAQPDKTKWEEACRMSVQASSVPWVLLSAGVDYPVFAEQTASPVKPVPVVFWPAGRSGRKLWKCLQMSELNS
jgi:tagatose-1,6-bisphosphate aldolase